MASYLTAPCTWCLIWKDLRLQAQQIEQDSSGVTYKTEQVAVPMSQVAPGAQSADPPPEGTTDK